MKIIFSNGKGYLCGIYSYVDNPYLFSNYQTPLSLNERYIITDEGVYEFVIEQEDYENAHKSP